MQIISENILNKHEKLNHEIDKDCNKTSLLANCPIKLVKRLVKNEKKK